MCYLYLKALLKVLQMLRDIKAFRLHLSVLIIFPMLPFKLNITKK